MDEKELALSAKEHEITNELENPKASKIVDKHIALENESISENEPNSLKNNFQHQMV